MQRSDDNTTLPFADVDLAHPHLAALEAYWRSLGNSGGIPARTALNPARVESVLPYAFILQRVAPGTARFRVAGQRIHDLLKMDPRGMPFSTLFDQTEHDALRHTIESAFQDPAIVGLHLRSNGNLVRAALDGAMLLLPMRDGAGATTRLLGAMVTPAHPALKPRRFVLRRDLRNRHDRLATPRPVSVPLTPVRQHDAQTPDVTKRPALRLVVNNG